MDYRVTFNNKTIYTVTVTRHRVSGNNSVNTYVGDLEHLVNDVFGYTIECNGYSKQTCKSLATMLKCLNNGDSYWSLHSTYEGRKATKEEIASFLNQARA